MAITLKDENGMEQSVSSKGTVNAALTTGIIGTALGVLNGGAGILNGGVLGSTATGGITRECLVDKDMFYQTLISQINTQSDRDIQTERRFAGLEAAISVNSTANQYQNSIIRDQFEWERLLSEKNLALATCRCVQGDVYLSPATLADSFVSPTRVLDSHEAREYLPGRPFGGNGRGCGCGGF